MRIVFLLSMLGLVAGCIGLDSAVYPDRFLVENGQPVAEIVIAEEPPRTTQLAAHDLQLYIEKITGARLPIVTQPSGEGMLPIYLGVSPHTERLGLSNDGLLYGAYRIVSTEDWLAILGQDTDFQPVEPWARSNSHWIKGDILEQWDAITGRKWGNPMSRLYKSYSGRAFDFGKPREEWVNPDDPIHFWTFDEKGTYNGVCDYLRSLGVRWYMPGDVGEVVPTQASLPLPRIDQEVHPDFAVRRFNFRYRTDGYDVALWAMRLGVRDPYDLMVAHGLTPMTKREEYLAAHPEYFGLYNGKRMNSPETKYNHPCLSNEAFIQDTADWARAMYDHYGYEAVSVMPYDAFTRMCECELCKGKDTYERGYRGSLSDYVWSFVVKVANEVAKTHPDKLVVNCAYGSYREPPLQIEQLPENVLVCIVNGRRPTATSPEERQAQRELRAGWAALTPHDYMIFENYPFTSRGAYVPSFVPHTNAASINATKGESLGEDIWLTMQRGLTDAGYNHFKVYFTARMYWGGKEQDIDQLLGDYYRLFYGPAEQPMRALFEHCEANWTRMQTEADAIAPVFRHLDAARASVPADSVYAERIAVMADFLSALERKLEMLQRPRGQVPTFVLSRNAAGITFDGQLDEPYWDKVWSVSNARLRESRTGRRTYLNTTFKGAWGRGGLYLAVTCQTWPGQEVTSSTREDDDPAILDGDTIEILLETEQHAYYQIVINPAGAVADADRRDSGKGQWQWDSNAEVGTYVGDGFWRAEVFIPVVDESDDPFLHVVGRRPTESLPWHFNIGRQVVSPGGKQYFSYSPTSSTNFHVPREFAVLYNR